MTRQPLLEVEGLTKQFPVSTSFFSREKKVAHAVDGVSFSICQGEILGLVGESGSGKTTTARLLLRLIAPTAGTVRFQGNNIFDLRDQELLRLREHMQLISQDPLSSFNPRKRIKHILAQPLVIHHAVERDELDGRISDLLVKVGLNPPEQFLNRFPHELSGGQRQRIGIARAISLNPQFIVADEPVSALDVSVRAQILNLIKSLQKTYGLSFLFITHDLSVVRSTCHRVAVMYAGKIVEYASVEEIFNSPAHPYTQALIAATPVPDPVIARARENTLLTGDVPSLIDIPRGCRFRTRCPWREEKCALVEPELVEIEKGHLVSCHVASRKFQDAQKS